MKEYIIAKYVRLSIEDEKTESMSITHQRLLLDMHIEALEIPYATVLEFVDNGHSGTNMERPAVQEMLDLVRAGRIQCIAVKDFSRFSRNMLDSGYFIEQVFPLYQVRFISVADDFDSNDYKNDTGGLDVAFKFLMHEYYSADLSNKVKSAKRIKMKRGEHIVEKAIYGYRKNDLGKWEPDPGPAEVVRMIFKLALEGNSTAQIRDELCAAQYPTPQEYIDLKRGKDITPQCMWTARMVFRTLDNEQYTGSYVSGKQNSKAVGSSSKVWVDRSEWIVIPDSHPPIVSKEDFAAVGEIFGKYNNFCTVKPTGNLLQDDETRPKRSRMISGERLPGNVIYGYTKDVDGKLAIDHAAAEVIREIFELAAHGLSVAEIRDKLTQAGYPIPVDHIKKIKGKSIIPSSQWTAKSVRGILQNIQYAGAYVSGKILKNYDTGKKYHTAQSDWVIIPGMNPAIVSEELFSEVQEMFKASQTKRRVMRPRDYLLNGNIVKCGCCGYALSYDSSTRTGLFRCQHTLADSSAECHKMKVVATELDEVVLTVIRKQAEVVLNAQELSELQTVSTGGRQIADFEKETALCIEQRQRAYEQFILREIGRDAYQMLRTECSERLEHLNGQIAMLKQAERDRKAGILSANIAKSVLSEAVTPREIVETLVDKVLVYPGKRIDIKWKIADFTKVEKMEGVEIVQEKGCWDCC